MLQRGFMRLSKRGKRSPTTSVQSIDSIKTNQVREGELNI